MNFQYTIAAIPTRYKGIQFRSRLESRWAAFFDIMGWRWDYEPFDLKGWIPDFIIHGAREKVLVEVKPIYHLHGRLADDLSRQTSASGMSHDILVLGVTTGLRESTFMDVEVIGWLGEYIRQNRCATSPHEWGDAIPHAGSGGVIGFHHSDMSYRDRISGVHNGDRGAGLVSSDVREAWIEAGNVVQWVNEGAAA